MSEQAPSPDEVAKMVATPEDFFDRPEEVVESTSLSKGQKIEILRSWATDEDLLQMATSENMDGGEPGHLHSVRKLLAELEGDS